jgi:hypothetical protein
MLYHCCEIVTELGTYVWVELDKEVVRMKKKALFAAVKPNQIKAENDGTVEADNLVSAAVLVRLGHWKMEKT